MNLVKTVILLTTILVGQAALAGDIIKVEVSQVSPKAEVSALETYYGEVLKVDSMLGHSKKAPLGKLIEAHQIEMKDGSIYYPEELEYVIESAASGRIGAINKAPHTPD